MSYELYLRQYEKTGAVKHAYVPALWARYTESVNDQYPLVYALNFDADAAQDLAEFDVVEVLVRNQALGIDDFERAFVGIVRDWAPQTDEDGITSLVVTAPNEKSILSWRHVLWAAGTNRRSDYTGVEAETIMKEVVEYNFTADASVANGRWREGDLAGMGLRISIATDQARGNTLSAAFMGKNCLDILQRIAVQGGGDFDLAWQGYDSGSGYNEWEFEFYPDQLGEDKSSGASRVLFALENNTMREPRLRRIGAGATVAIAAGQGEGAARDVSEVEGPDYAADYDIETFVDARSEDTAAGREFRGGKRLDELRVWKELTFGVQQTGDIFYSPVDVTGRKTYRAGDLVLVSYAGVEQVRKITRVRVDWDVAQSDNRFSVEVEARECDE
jgi:hypothetical protein